ncbi:unnamed protein product [Prunus armeniaca]
MIHSTHSQAHSRLFTLTQANPGLKHPVHILEEVSYLSQNRPPAFSVHEYVELSMSGSTGERSFADIITCIRYWVIHSKPIPSLFTLLDELRGLVIRQHGFSFLFLLDCVNRSSEAKKGGFPKGSDPVKIRLS